MRALTDTSLASSEGNFTCMHREPNLLLQATDLCTRRVFVFHACVLPATVYSNTSQSECSPNHGHIYITYDNSARHSTVRFTRTLIVPCHAVPCLTRFQRSCQRNNGLEATSYTSHPRTAGVIMNKMAAQFSALHVRLCSCYLMFWACHYFVCCMHTARNVKWNLIVSQPNISATLITHHQSK